MKKNGWSISGMTALLLAFGLVLAGCGKNGSGGGKASPVSDFQYELWDAAKDQEEEMLIITKYTGKGGKVVIPETIEGIRVAAIGPYAFYGESMEILGITFGSEPIGPGYDITEVVIPGGVFWIKENAFMNCKKLTSVTMWRTYVVLEQGVFMGCENLSELNIPEKNENPEIGTKVLALSPGYAYNASFEGCKKLPLKMRARLKEMGFDEP
jgi:hypothetical protein